VVGTGATVVGGDWLDDSVGAWDGDSLRLAGSVGDRAVGQGGGSWAVGDIVGDDLSGV